MGTLRFRDLPAIRDGKMDCFFADPREIVVDTDYNVRDMKSAETLAHVDWIADSIRSDGFIQEQPLTVRKRGEDLVLVRGHCRLSACLKLIADGIELPKIPVMQLAKGYEAADLLFDQESSNSGLRLDPLARARLVRKAKAMGINDAEIARRMHWKSVSSVKQHLDMLESLPDEAKRMVANGEVAATTAVKAVKDHGEQAVAVLNEAKAAAKPDKAGKVKVRPRDVRPAKAPEPEPESLPSVREMIDMGMDTSGAQTLARALAPASHAPIAPSSPPVPHSVPRTMITGLIEATMPIFEAVRLTDLSMFEEGEMVGLQITIEQARAFDAAFSKVTGGES